MLNGKRVLVENCPGLGDLIMLTPALRALKARYPGCRTSVVSYARNLPIVSRLPYVDRVYGIQKGRLLGRVAPAAHFWRQDYVVFTTWQSQLARLARLMRVPHRAGVCKEKYRESGLFHRILPWDNFDDPRFRAVSAARQLSIGLGVELETDGICEVSPPNEAERQSARAKLRALGLPDGQPYAAIAPFANTEKNIPFALAEGTARHLATRHGLACVLIHGGASPYASELREAVGGNRVIDLCGRTSLMEMAAILQGARCAFAANSGPMHIACALGTDTAVMFSNDNLPKWKPLRHCFPVTAGMPCAPCDHLQEKRCPHRGCLEGIRLPMVTEAFDQILQGGHEAAGGAGERMGP